MRIILLTGASPPGACGVGDYTERLAQSLKSLGVDVRIVSVDRWRLADVAAARKTLGKVRPDIVHLQYPTPGAGCRLGPQILAVLRRSVVTVHEGSQAHFLRKLSLYPFTVRASHLVFTSEYERQFVTKLAPWIARISSVIPLGSNIRVAQGGTARSHEEVVYFGLIMPTKGLEDVLQMAKLIRATGAGLRVRIVGKASPGHEAYFEQLRQQSRGLPVIWESNLEDEQVATRLASCAVGYAPFPDGASERRASLKAMLLNGVAVVSTCGAHTSTALRDVVRCSAGPQDALEAIRLLLDNPLENRRLGQKGVEYMRQFAWDGIANLHLQMYERVIRERVSDRRLLCAN